MIEAVSLNFSVESSFAERWPVGANIPWTQDKLVPIDPRVLRPGDYVRSEVCPRLGEKSIDRTELRYVPAYGNRLDDAI
jgi:hypothetical protein